MKRRIAILVFSNYDNDMRVIRETETLNDRGFNPVVFCSTDKKNEKKGVYYRNSVKVVKAVDRLPYIIKRPRDLLPFFRLINVVCNYPEKFDVLHCHDVNASLIGNFLAKKLRIPLICDFHELFIDYLTHHEKNALKMLILFLFNRFWENVGRNAVRYARSFITVNDSLSAIYRVRWRLKHDPLVIHNYSSKKRKAKGSIEDDYFRKLFNIPTDKRLLIFQGTLFYDKGVEVILKAFQKQKKYAVVFLGMGALTGLIKKYCRIYPDIFYYHDPVPASELVQYTKCADAGLAPIGNRKKSHIYSSPNKVYEYLAAGIPFICSRLPEMEKIVRESQTGIAVNPNNPAALFEGTERLFSDRNYPMMKKNAQKAFIEKYCWEIEEKKLIDFYRNLTKL